jgi:hypothetical protein
MRSYDFSRFPHVCSVITKFLLLLICFCYYSFTYWLGSICQALCFFCYDMTASSCNPMCLSCIEMEAQKGEVISIILWLLSFWTESFMHVQHAALTCIFQLHLLASLFYELFCCCFGSTRFELWAFCLLVRCFTSLVMAPAPFLELFSPRVL